MHMLLRWAVFIRVASSDILLCTFFNNLTAFTVTDNVWKPKHRLCVPKSNWWFRLTSNLISFTAYHFMTCYYMLCCLFSAELFRFIETVLSYRLQKLHCKPADILNMLDIRAKMLWKLNALGKIRWWSSCCMYEFKPLVELIYLQTYIETRENEIWVLHSKRRENYDFDAHLFSCRLESVFLILEIMTDFLIQNLYSRNSDCCINLNISYAHVAKTVRHREFCP